MSKAYKLRDEEAQQFYYLKYPVQYPKQSLSPFFQNILQIQNLSVYLYNEEVIKHRCVLKMKNDEFIKKNIKSFAVDFLRMSQNLSIGDAFFYAYYISMDDDEFETFLKDVEDMTCLTDEDLKYIIDTRKEFMGSLKCFAESYAFAE